MNTTEFKKHLRAYPNHELNFQLPDGGMIPIHAHVTEIGRVDKTFVDCGGTLRKSSRCVLQTWVADDTDHRLSPAKLAEILDHSEPIVEVQDLEVEVEYEDFVISQFPIVDAGVSEGRLTFILAFKHTDCLAKEECIPDSCCSGGGCC